MMMLFINKLDQFGSFRLLYTSACEVVEEDAPGGHQLLQDISIARAAINETSHQALISISYRGPPPSWSCYGEGAEMD